MHYDIVGGLIIHFRAGRVIKPCGFARNWSYQRQIDDCGIGPAAISQAALNIKREVYAIRLQFKAADSAWRCNQSKTRCRQRENRQLNKNNGGAKYTWHVLVV